MGIHSVESQDFVVFDYDGTIAEEGGQVPDSVFTGIEALRQVGVPTSVITARPYLRLATVCGGEENLGRIVSTDYPLATERGARIVNRSKDSNLVYHQLTTHELDAISDTEAYDGIDFIGFCPKELRGTSYIWNADASRQDEMISRFGHDAIVVENGKLALRRALQEAEPCLVTIKFTVSDPDHSIVQGDLNVVWERKAAVMLGTGVTKLSALELLCDAMGHTIEAVRYAGNDTSDLHILEVPDLRERIFVGDRVVVGMAEPVTRLVNPHALGEYLINRVEPVEG